MATETEAPRLEPDEVLDLTATQGLTSGTTYLIQPESGFCFVHEGPNEPDIKTAPAWILKPGVAWRITQETNNFYVWGTGRLTIGATS